MENTKQTDPPLESEKVQELAMATFFRELPDLLAEAKNIGRYVSYHGDKRIAIGPSCAALFEQCKELGILPAEIFLALIHEDACEIEEIENGFYEFDEIEDEPNDGSAMTP